MSEIAITLPFSLIGDSSIDEFIQKVRAFESEQTEVNERVIAAENARKELARNMIGWAVALEQVLDGDFNDFQKAQALRQISSDARTFANFVQTQEERR